MMPEKLFIVLQLLMVQYGFSQNPATPQLNALPNVRYDVFNRPSLGNLQITPPTPFQFEPVSSINGTMPRTNAKPVFNGNINPLGDINNQSRMQQQQIMQEVESYSSNNNKEAQQAFIQRELMDEKMYRESIEWMNKTKSYRQAFNELAKLNPDSFSLSKAVFIVENAWFDNKFQYEKFKLLLQSRAKVVKQLLKNENLDTHDNMALNYGIQKLYKQTNYYYDNKSKQTITIKPFRYDFEDIRGEKDYIKMFTAKMMATGKGQCHSMPLLYLMIAEQLGAKAWLSLAPQHSFIQFTDKHNNLLNFETTNGNLVSSNWMLQSGFVNANALKSKSYLDTLSQRKLYAQCLADLLLGYIQKFKYDEFAENLRRNIMHLNPGNMTALIIDANIKTLVAQNAINAAGKPKEEDLPKYPEAYKAYSEMMKAYDRVDKMGYQDMPKEAYQRWLKSFDQEKKKQENKELQEKMKNEMQMLKRTKSVIINKPKG
jgi:hypothetical protein